MEMLENENLPASSRDGVPASAWSRAADSALTAASALARRSESFSEDEFRK